MPPVTRPSTRRDLVGGPLFLGGGLVNAGLPGSELLSSQRAGVAWRVCVVDVDNLLAGQRDSVTAPAFDCVSAGLPRRGGGAGRDRDGAHRRPDLDDLAARRRDDRRESIGALLRQDPSHPKNGSGNLFRMTGPLEKVPGTLLLVVRKYSTWNLCTLALCSSRCARRRASRRCG